MSPGPRGVVERFRHVLRFDDPPWRLALSLAVGVFISFTPFYGLQTLLSIGVAVVCRLNRAATVAGAWLNLPWFAPLIYAGAVKVGGAVVPGLEGVRGLSIALMVGSTLLGVVAASVTYVVALRVLSRRRGGASPGPAGEGRVSLDERRPPRPPGEPG